MTVKLLAQSGPYSWLVDGGVGEFEGKEDVVMARLYDRLAHTLGEPWPLDAFLARGYWDEVTASEIRRSSVEAEVAELLG